MVTQGGIPEVEDITLNVVGVNRNPAQELTTVRVRSTHPVIARMGAMRSLAQGRARAKALRTVGIVDTVTAAIKGMKIQRFTHLQGSPETVQRDGRMETLEYTVAVVDR